MIKHERRNILYEVLSSTFVYNGKINDYELNQSIILYIKTDKELLYQLSSKRMTAESIVWRTLFIIANECLALEYSKKYKCTKQQLLQWLEEFGNGSSSLQESIKYAEGI